MRYLIDTCVWSEIMHPKGCVAVKTFVQDLPDHDVFVSVISIGEISKGIGLLRDGSRKQRIVQALEQLQKHYRQQTLSIDADTAMTWGSLTSRAKKQGRVVHVADGLIAATAHQHGLHVVTRNVSDFEPTGALIINPWEHQS